MIVGAFMESVIQSLARLIAIQRIILQSLDEKCNQFNEMKIKKLFCNDIL